MMILSASIGEKINKMFHFKKTQAVNETRDATKTTHQQENTKTETNLDKPTKGKHLSLSLLQTRLCSVSIHHSL